MQYKIQNGAVVFGADVILKNVNFDIKNTEKIAIVGRNGCGKTTLLKLIAGEVDLHKRDSDEDIFIVKSGNPEIGYLKQMAFEDKTITMEEEVRKAFSKILSMQKDLEEKRRLMESDPSEQNIKIYTALHDQFVFLGGYYFEKEYEVVLKEFGFTGEDKKKRLEEFSGGQQTKIAFVKMLLSKPDILLLDEPTNHLDMRTIEWLEQYLKDYKRAVVIVSHDRMFLDRIVDVVYEIEYKTPKRYVGNYSAFMEQKKLNYEKQLKDYKEQQAEIARLNEIVDKFKNKPTKVAMTRSKLKQIEHMDKIEAPDSFDTKSFHTNLTPRVETGKDVLSVRNLVIGYDIPLATISMEAKRGRKYGVIGGNGIGKSTFLKTLTGKVDALGGEFSFGPKVEIGYFDQQMAQYSSDKQVIDDYWDEFPTLTQTEVRNELAAFLFTGDDVFKQVNMLSGGEKVRLALCKIFKTRPNVLILDEPTNHMDIVGKETLEQMLFDYEGTVLFVSHDRYFVKRIADELLVLEEGHVEYYSFGYEEYEEKNAQRNAKYLEQMAFTKETATLKEVKTEKPKNYNPGKEESKRRRKLEKLEGEIAVLEEHLEKLKTELSAPENSSDYTRLQEIQSQIEEEEEKLLTLMEEWENYT